MGIARPPDPYGMTAPPAWPDVDEDILRGCGDAFDTVLKTVTTQREAAERERPQMFEGVGIWSGGAADAAHDALRQRIADLESLRDKLQASVDLFDYCVREVVNAKNLIIDVVDIAHNFIDRIQNHPQIEDKAAAIQAIVEAAREANIVIIAEAGGKISGKRPDIGETTAPRGDSLQLWNSKLMQSVPVSPVSNTTITGDSGVTQNPTAPMAQAAVPVGGNTTISGDSGAIQNPTAPMAQAAVPVGGNTTISGDSGAIQNPGLPAPPPQVSTEPAAISAPGTSLTRPAVVPVPPRQAESACLRVPCRARHRRPVFRATRTRLPRRPVRRRPQSSSAR